MMLTSLQPGENEPTKQAKPAKQTAPATEAKQTGPVSLLYSDFGMPVPARLRRGPLLVFEGLSAPLADLFPRFNHMPREYRP